MTAIRPAAIEAHAYRAPVEAPVTTSFGVMRDRPAVLVRAVDRDGAEGWGEVWCNFPSVGAEHRARLVADVVAPLLLDRSFAGPEDAFATASSALEVLAIQTGEFGPIAQAVAGVDLALWDLVARRSGMPLYRRLGGASAVSVPAYASGLNPDGPERLAAERRRQGYDAFKLKVGFGRERDLRNLAALRETLGDAVTLMIDANQGFARDEAAAMGRAVAPFRLDWFEEPMRADAPLDAWRRLAAECPVPLAGGENLRGAALDEAIEAGALRVIQPDVGKWGGFSGTLHIARKAIQAGRRYCPHWLGGGVGLVASLHLLAAVGGDGLLEVDANPNPLRDLMVPIPDVRDGRMPVPQGPGLGVAPDLAALKRYRTWP